MHRELFFRAFALCMLVALLAGAADAQDPSLVGWWKFDDGPGPTAFDSSGNENHGSLVGGVQWVPMETGGAMEFDGSSGYITVPFSESLRVKNRGAGFTLTAWFKPDAVPTEYKCILQQADLNGTGRTWLLVHNVNEVRCSLGGTATQSGFAIEGGTWYHGAVVVTENGTTDAVQIYVNGQPAGAATTRNVEDSEGVFYIGCHKNITNLWDGMIDDLRVYNRPLSAAEIKAMVPPKVKARNPSPADGDVTVVMPLFTWTAGETALLHSVYLGTDPNLGPENLVQARMPMTLYYHSPGLTPGATYYWRVDEIEADMTTVHTGDVWSFVARPSTAYLPDPADGANEASPDPNMTLTWWPGKDAIDHHVYFGDSFADVNDGAAGTDKGTQKETTFKPGSLAPLTSYFWRVDELSPAGTVQPGGVWAFTTFEAVDDFERYTDEEGSRIYEAWADGWVNNTGSRVGYLQAPFAEQKVVNSGRQSMPLDYNNVNSPYYSEASLAWASPQNWTAGGADTLVLYVSGNWRNATEPLYVGVEDTGSRIGIVAHPDPMVVANPKWQRWAIPLSEFSAAGVNLRAVKTVYIGLGDPDAPKPGGAGLIFVDDIRLTRPTDPTK